MPLPVAHSLIGASIVALTVRDLSWKDGWKPILIGAAIGAIPDLDLIITWGLRWGLKYHGSYTHSILFAFALGSTVALLRKEVNVRAASGYIGAVLSHGLLDVLTKKEFGGVQLLWPFSTERYKWGLMSNYEFYPNPAQQSVMEILQQSWRFCAREFLIVFPILLVIIVVKSRHRWLPLLGPKNIPHGESHGTRPE